MNPIKRTEKITGVLFLTAMVASLLGGGLLESVLHSPGYLVNVSANTTLGLNPHATILGPAERN